MFAMQLGESANELAERWRGGYRGGFPDFIAVEPSIRAYNYDKSRIYTGAIGLHDRRWMYDPNLALDNPSYEGPHPGTNQPFYAGPLSDSTITVQDAGLSTGAKIAIGVGIAAAVIGGGATIYFVRRRRR